MAINASKPTGVSAGNSADAQITTTAGYCHAEALSVASPLDTLPPHAPPNLIPFTLNPTTQPADQRAFLCA